MRLNRRRIPLLFTALATGCSGQVLYSDIGSNNSFSTNGWCVSGASAAGCTTLANRTVAASFTPSVSANLSTISLPLSLVGGTNEAIIYLTTNSSSGTPGTVLQTWEAENLPAYGGAIPLTVVTAMGTVALQAGTKYWVQVSCLASDTMAYWYTNNEGLGGGITSINSAPFEALSGYSGQTLPAFSVSGATTSSGTLGISPGSLTFTMNVGGPLPQSQNVSLSSSSGSISWSEYPDSNATMLFALGPLSGTVTAGSPATVSVNPVSYDLGLSAGTYGPYPLTVTYGAGQSQYVNLNVTLIVVQSAPTGGTLGVSTNSVSFASVPGQLPPPQMLSVTSSSGSLSYGTSVTYPESGPTGWVTVSPSSGTATPSNPSQVTISLNAAASNFGIGSYKATVNVTNTAGTQAPLQVAVTDNVVSNSLKPQTTTMVFAAATSGSAPFQYSQDPQTLSVGTATGGSLAYYYEIEPSPPQAGPACLGSPNISATTQPWLLVGGSNSSGNSSAPNVLKLSVQPPAESQLSPGTYVYYLNLTDQNLNQTNVYVYLVLQDTSVTAPLSFTYTSGGTLPTPQEFGTGSGGDCQATTFVVGASSDQGWLGVNLPGNPPSTTLTLGTNATFNVTATPQQSNGEPLAPGTYYGTVALTDAQGDVSVASCTLTVTAAPSKTATVTQLNASPNPATTAQAVALSATVAPSAATGSITFYDGATSLGSANLSAGAATLSLKFTAGSHSLTAAYSGNTNYASSTSTPVNLQVNGGLAASTISLTALPASQAFGSPVSLTATVNPSTATGTVVFLDGTTQIGSVNLNNGVATLSISTLTVGTHTLTASYSGDANDTASNSAPVGVNITSSNQPVILAGGIVNAASYAAVNGVGSPVAPGSLVAIFTSALSATAASFTTATLPGVLGGVGVTFNGFSAPMVQVVPSGTYPFVSVQVPFEALPAGQSSATVPVVITVNGVPSAAVQTQMIASEPGIFTLNAQGTGQAVLVNLADYTIAGPAGSSPGAHPIARGQPAFFYVTGLGAMSPSVADGSGTCPASTGLCNANAMPAVFVGGVQAQVVFAGQAPGFPGVAQINLTIPPGAPTGGSVSLIVKSADGTVTSNPVTIAVQ